MAHKWILLICILFLSASISCKESQSADKPVFSEKFRPQIHYTPKKNWMNDPNGMFFLNGKFHLFYQYNPFGDRWGHMSWGHAVSKDLVHWQHLPLALPEENGVMIFSGSAVVDYKNTSNFSKNGEIPIVAIYTGYRESDGLQFQCIAYSLDEGLTWKKYVGNPVIDTGSKNFRDPKVFWYEPEQKWVMVVALSVDRKVQFYQSKNLKHWQLLSEFGPAGAVKGIWECPDLFQLPVDDNPEITKWVLTVNLGSHSISGGSGAQYFIGHFDGRRFIPDQSLKNKFNYDLPDGKLIADFEGNSYGEWHLSGDAFGKVPAKGTLNNQNPVFGFLGKGLVNSFNHGDATTGKLISPPFRIDHDYINFLVGGGSSGSTAVRLKVSDKILFSTSGQNSEMLEWQSWNVSPYKGKMATIEIIDSTRGGWGHILVDHIFQSNQKMQNQPENAHWVDYGKDFYAAVTWANYRTATGNKLWLGWMNNWQYAQKLPTFPWRGSMSLVRELQLKSTNEGIKLVQIPVEALTALRIEGQSWHNVPIAKLNAELKKIANWTLPVEMKIKLLLNEQEKITFDLCIKDSAKLILTYDPGLKSLSLDRTASGKVDFDESFPAIMKAPVQKKNGELYLHIFLDTSSIEIFVNGGEYVLTSRFFPEAIDQLLRVRTESSSGMLKSFDIWRLKSIWSKK